MGPLGRRVQALMENAAAAGVSHAWEWQHLSPAQLDLEIKALDARRKRELEQIDLLAWLAGRYVLCALHAPRRYPRRPDGIILPRAPMSDAQMKGVLMRLAEKGREQNGHS